MLQTLTRIASSRKVVDFNFGHIVSKNTQVDHPCILKMQKST